MVFHHVIPQALFDHLLGDCPSKRHLQHDFYSCLMAGLHHILQFPDSIAGCGIRRLWRKAVGIPVSPVIPVLQAFFKIIYRHQMNLVNPQFCKIRNLFYYAEKCSFILYLGRKMLCKPTHMQAVGNHSVVWKPQGPVSLPVIFPGIEDPADFVVLHLSFPAPHFPACKRFRIGICHDFSVDHIIILIIGWRKPLKGKITHFPYSHIHRIGRARLALPCPVQQ